MRSFVDASVIVAILKREAGHEELIKQLSQTGARLYVSPLVRFEAVAAMVKLEVDNLQQKLGKVSSADRKRFIEDARKLIDAFITELEAGEIIIDGRVGQAALDAMGEYGRMAGHPAALNFGDCFSYSVAKANRLQLLYKGNDFSETDLA
ncbi:type II toxin-antitoxin system VapC family toxin [Brucella pituitosa]|uniref:type II toxin-antitoxin system VapC family toxin n=1 Tax=Brucella pituitosa TaxID=571256 RepID=UPI000C2747ED|nr:type II toxin-antitoxin system VapC family toxin [Brucella pituitosa]PJO49357.1 VapC toxin family PIN domain ribonuclease [Brucella pituitosa]